MIPEYPLQWPDHIERSKTRESGKFRSSLSSALDNVRKSLARFASDSGKKIDGLVISSNVTLGNHKPKDPGVSVWFTWDGLQVSIPIDRYTSVEANLQAIHHVIEARRTELRHGTLALVRATFRGFQALPAPINAERPREWWEVLGVDRSCTRAEAGAAYRARAKKIHEDGGFDADYLELNLAKDAAMNHFK